MAGEKFSNGGEELEEKCNGYADIAAKAIKDIDDRRARGEDVSGEPDFQKIIVDYYTEQFPGTADVDSKVKEFRDSYGDAQVFHTIFASILKTANLGSDEQLSKKADDKLIDLGTILDNGIEQSSDSGFTLKEYYDLVEDSITDDEIKEMRIEAGNAEDEPTIYERKFLASRELRHANSKREEKFDDLCDLASRINDLESTIENEDNEARINLYEETLKFDRANFEKVYSDFESFESSDYDVAERESALSDVIFAANTNDGVSSFKQQALENFDAEDDELDSLYQEKRNSLIEEYLSLDIVNNPSEINNKYDFREKLSSFYKADIAEQYIDVPVNPKESTKDYAERINAPTFDKWIDNLKNENTSNATESPEDNFEFDPSKLVAGRLNVELDAREAAHDIAVKMWEEEASKKKFIGKMIWRLGKEARIAKFRSQAYDAISKYSRGENVDMDLGGWSTNAGMDRFVSAYINNFEAQMIHGYANEEFGSYFAKKDDNGVEKFYCRDREGKEVEVTDESDNKLKAFKELREAIKTYSDPSNTANEEARLNSLRGAIDHINHDYFANDSDKVIADNYFEVAKNARALAMHEGGLDKVIEGFAMIDGTARRGIRTAESENKHRELYDKIMEKGLSCVPMWAVGSAAWLATRATQSAGKKSAVAAGAAVGLLAGPGGAAVGAIVAGAAFSGFVAAKREGRRISKDRNTIMRRLARGEQIANMKYDKELGETQYEIVKSSDLTRELNDLLASADESGDSSALVAEYAKIKTLIEYSDSKGVDLISYIDGDKVENIENQRMELDVAMAKVKQKYGDALSVDIQDTINTIESEISADINAKDKAFAKIKRRRAIGRGLKTASVGVLASFGAQEVFATFSADRVGYLEKLLDKGNNNVDAKETTLASFLETPRNVMSTSKEIAKGISEDDLAQYENAGYRINSRIIHGEDTYKSSEMTAQDYMGLHGVDVKRSWLDNNTSEFDGNELGALYTEGDRGFVTDMSGISTGAEGLSMDFSEQGIKDHMALYLTLNGDSAPIRIDGVVGSNGQVEFIPKEEWLQERIASHDYKWAEVCYDNGANTDGVHEITMFATAVGDGGSALPDIIPGEDILVPGEDTVVYDIIAEGEEPIERLTAAAVYLGVPVNHLDLTPVRNRSRVSGEQRPAPTPAPTSTPVSTPTQNPAPVPVSTPAPASTSEPASGETAEKVVSSEQAITYEAADINKTAPEILNLAENDIEGMTTVLAVENFKNLSEEDRAKFLSGEDVGGLTKTHRDLLIKYGLVKEASRTETSTDDEDNSENEETIGDNEISAARIESILESIDGDEKEAVRNAASCWNSLSEDKRATALIYGLSNSEFSDKDKYLLNKYFQLSIKMDDIIPSEDSNEPNITEGQILAKLHGDGKTSEDAKKVIEAYNAWKGMSSNDREAEVATYKTDGNSDIIDLLTSNGLLEISQE